MSLAHNGSSKRSNPTKVYIPVLNYPIGSGHSGITIPSNHGQRSDWAGLHPPPILARHSMQGEVTPLLVGRRSYGGSRVLNSDRTSAKQRAICLGGLQSVSSRESIAIKSTIYQFFVTGLFISTLGTLLPQLQEYYGLGDSLMSVVFLCPCLGYLTSSVMNRTLHIKFGRRGAMMIGPTCQLLYAIVGACHPIFPLFLVALAASGLSGFIDGSIYSWIGGMGHANVIIGLLHSAFSVGCIVGPFLAGSFIKIWSRPWYHWYIVMCVFSFVGLILLSFAFWPQDSDEYKAEIAQGNEDNSAQNHQLFPATLLKAETLVGIGFVFICLGVEASITSWIPTYIKRSRNSGDLSSSLFVSFFHIGMAAGRLTMGYVTDLFGLYRPMTVAICAALACQVLFYLVVNSSSSTAIIGILGFFIGPGYPSAMIALTIVLPANERVGTTSIVNSAGQAGAAILPFALGALSGRFGIEVFNYIVSGEILALLVLWRWLIKTSSKES